MRIFYLDRKEDATGVSGVGRVAEGVEFGDGTCVVRWRTTVRSTVFYNSIADVQYIHGHGGLTRIVFADEPIEEAFEG